MRTAALLAAAIAAALLSGCSAGQITQTSTQQPAIPGVDVDSSDGTIGLRNVYVVDHGPNGYPKGGSAPLSVRIVNSSQKQVTLTGVSAGGLGMVAMVSGSSASGSPAASSTPAASSSPSASSAASPGVSPSPSGTRSATPAATPSTTPAAPAGSKINVPIPANGLVALSPESTQYLQVVGLTQDLLQNATVPLTLTFDNGVTISVNAPFGVPSSPLPRSPLPLSPEEH
jgi:copper(I)-binding protein